MTIDSAPTLDELLATASTFTAWATGAGLIVVVAVLVIVFVGARIVRKIASIVIVLAILAGGYFLLQGKGAAEVADVIEQTRAQYGLTLTPADAFKLIAGGKVTVTSPDGNTVEVTIPDGSDSTVIR